MIATRLQPYNIVWTSPSRDSSESMPCGGGDIGLNVWVQEGDLLIYLARSGTFDEINTMPKLGRLRVRLEPNPLLKFSDFRQELKLFEGFVQIIAKRDDVEAVIDIWVDVFRPVVHVNVKSNAPTALLAAYESWRLEDREFAKAEMHSSRSWISAPEKGVVRKDDVSFSRDVVQFVHRNHGRTQFDLLVEQQGLTAVREQLWNPLENLTWGGRVSGANLVAAGETDGQYASTPFRAWNLRSAEPATDHHVQTVLHVANAATMEEWEEGLRRNELATEQAGRKARLQTEYWWRQFWDRSHILVDPENPDPQSPRWQIGRNYQVFRYQLGCNAFGKYPTKFNGGLFTFDPQYVDPKKTLSPDFRQWGGGSFTAQNQRLLYWPMLKSGDFDMMKSQFDFYRRALGNAELRSKLYWGIEGACFVEQIENSGLPVAYEYGWKRKPEVEAGVEDNAWVCYQWDTVFEFCKMILDVNAFTGADIREYLPLIESCLRFYESFYSKDNDRFDISPGTACETYKSALNPAPTVAALRGVLTGLLELPAEYLSGDQRAWSRKLLERIPGFVLREMEGHQTISPAWEWSHKQNCELPQLYPVYPWGLYGIGKPDLQIAIDTWKYGADAPDQKQIISWHQDPIFCARLGLTDEAAELTIGKLGDAPRRFPTWWGPGHDWVPDHNWGGSGMIALQEMLMQTVGEKIYLLPAWPKEWDVDFKLHAPGNTTVECSVRAGQVKSMAVHPMARAKDVVVC